MPKSIPAVDPRRLRLLVDRPIHSSGRYVLYWMIANRRTRWNHALDHAILTARSLSRPLLVLEPLRAGHRWANARSHRFILDGMLDNARRFAAAGVGYAPYVERRDGDGRGLLARFARDAAVVITDDWPGYFVPRMLAAAAQLPVRLEAVDSCGLVPLRDVARLHLTARGFRRELHVHVVESWIAAGTPWPAADPLSGPSLPPCPSIPADIARRWPLDVPALTDVAVDHGVPAVSQPGGERAARKRLAHFLERDLLRYSEHRNDLEDDASSGLAPYLHFGHISPLEVAHAALDRCGWEPGRVVCPARGSAQGFWGLPAGAEGFLDQLLVWRELGFNGALHDGDRHGTWDTLPAWARATLLQHASDPRETLYTEEELEAATTHDPLWNAAQTQLLREGRIHNYLRMLWGKKVLEWSPDPRLALETLVQLNNRWALDGRDPNSYTGIQWIFGRYDRPWFPQRPIFGCVRYMSSASATRKLRTAGYVRRYGPDASMNEGEPLPSRSARLVVVER